MGSLRWQWQHDSERTFLASIKTRPALGRSVQLLCGAKVKARAAGGGNLRRIIIVIIIRQLVRETRAGERGDRRRTPEKRERHVRSRRGWFCRGAPKKEISFFAILTCGRILEWRVRRMEKCLQLLYPAVNSWSWSWSRLHTHRYQLKSVDRIGVSWQHRWTLLWVHWRSGISGKFSRDNIDLTKKKEAFFRS